MFILIFDIHKRPFNKLWWVKNSVKNSKIKTILYSWTVGNYRLKWERWTMPLDHRIKEYLYLLETTRCKCLYIKEKINIGIIKFNHNPFLSKQDMKRYEPSDGRIYYKKWNPERNTCSIHKDTKCARILEQAFHKI